MKNMVCPKCHAKDIVRLPVDLEAPNMLSGAKPPSHYKTINVTRYCCANCGYSEVWVNDPDNLKDLLKKYGF
jgi:predicted nucleic-acid-binding Zn-ribbon protein